MTDEDFNKYVIQRHGWYKPRSSTTYINVSFNGYVLAQPARPYAEIDAEHCAVIPDEQDDRFPHRCPRCNGQAYIGATQVECKAKCG